VSRKLLDQLGGLGELQEAHELWAASNQPERGSPGAGLALALEKQVQTADIDEGGRGQVENQGRAARVSVQERVDAGRECGSGGPVELAADIDHRRVGALLAHAEVQVIRRRPGLVDVRDAVVHGHGPAYGPASGA
jgi:hypothetical protein